jgi:5'-3' exonuclease
MGIPTYFSYIVKNYSNILCLYHPEIYKIDNFYLDCNSIIYDSIRKIEFTKHNQTNNTLIFSAVCKQIEEYIQTLKPQNLLFIAFDGVAPVAKLEQQRSRRYKSAYQTECLKTIMQQNDDVWSTTAITPGTHFMTQLNEYVRSYFSLPSKYGVNEIIVSTSEFAGEGEHKIFEYMRNHPTQQINLIYGLDADLIMLAMNHLHIQQFIYLYRETPEYIKSLNIDLEPNQSYIIDIPRFSEIITKQLLCTNIHDYIFLCFFLGNDFLPHFPALNIATGGIHKLLKVYKELGIRLTDNEGSVIFWQNVYLFISHLSLREEIFIQAEIRKRDMQEKNHLPNLSLEDYCNKFHSMPKYERTLEKYINPFHPGWQQRYYKALFGVNITDDIKSTICQKYIEGLEWTMKYYTTGCIDWRWYYPYHYPPLLEDLVKYIPLTEKCILPIKPPQPVNPLVQLCYVLPPQNLHLLPKNIEERLEKYKNIWYKKDCKFIWAFCRYFWESHVHLPVIPIDELEQFVNQFLHL